MVVKKAKVKRTRNAKAKAPAKEPVQNAMGLVQGWGAFPQNQGSPYTEQLSDVTTSFVNLRWYFVSNFRQFLSELYCEIGLVQTICDVPVDDALRGGIEIKSKQIDEDQIKLLANSLDRDDDLNTIGQAAKWNRLFGGAGVLILTDQHPTEPLNLAMIDADTPLEFRAVDMWELTWDKQNTEGYDPAMQTEDFEFYSYYGVQVHKSRVMRLTGITAPSFNRPRLRGWGFSCVEALIRSMNQYLKATDLSFEVLDEFKLDIYRIKNLINVMFDPTNGNKTKERIAQLNYFKNYQNAIVLDSEDEYQQKQLNFAGIAETMQQIRMQVAADMRMPLTKLFGISASGFNSGEDDIEVYNAMVESQVRNKIKYLVLRMCEIKCQKLFGMVPDDLTIEFKPLRVMSSEQMENVKTQKFNRAMLAKQAGEISQEEWRDICNKGNLFDINLDTTGLEDGGYMDDTVSEGANDPENPQDIDNPGADRMDTQKSRATETGGIGKEPVNKPAPRSADEPKDIAQIRPIRTASLETQRRRMRSGSRPRRVMANVWNALKAMFPKPLTDDQQEQRVLANMRRLNAEWKESDHPRDDDGKFGDGGGVPTEKEKPKTEKPKTEKEKRKAEYGHALEEQRKAAKALAEHSDTYDVEKHFETPEGDEHYKISKELTLQLEEAKKRAEALAPPRRKTAAEKRAEEKRAARAPKEIKRPAKTPEEEQKDAWLKKDLALIKAARVFRKNSASFDKASYEASGGDGWIDERRKYFYEVPKDAGLYKRCKEQAGGNWKYAVWLYEKQGGVWW